MGREHAVVRTKETWMVDIFDAGARRPVARLPNASYTETYNVEFQGGSWIVTQDDLKEV